MAKKLYRDTDNRVLAGVCAGIGEYTEIDPIIVRIIFLFSVIFGGISGWLYIIMALLIPIKPNSRNKKNNCNCSHENNYDDNTIEYEN